MKNEITENTEQIISMKKMKPYGVDTFLKYNYPLTIIADRYCGSYSEGEFLAFPYIFTSLSPDIEGDDIVCSKFWNNFDGIAGKGNTPMDAYNDLLEKMKFEKENGYPHCEK